MVSSIFQTSSNGVFEALDACLGGGSCGGAVAFPRLVLQVVVKTLNPKS